MKQFLVFALLLILLVFPLNSLAESQAQDVSFSYPLRGYSKSSGFIPNRSVEYKPGQWSNGAHLATDCVSSSGDYNVYPVYSGTVIKVNTKLNSAAGRYIFIEHNINGVTVYSEYQHLQSIKVNIGDKVTKSTIIGVAGCTGWTEEDYYQHLHYEIFTGACVAWQGAQSQYSKNVEYDGPITINGTTYYNPDSVIRGKVVIEGTIKADNLEFRGVAYPKTFVINPSRGWDVTRGSVVSNVNLTSIQSILSKNDGSWKQDTGAVNISGHYYPLSSLDTSIKFSQIPSAGDYTWTLIAKDSNNRTLRMDMPFKAVTSGNTDTATAKKEWKRNEDESEHHYDIWGSTSRSAVFYVNSQASNSSIQLKSETGKALVNQHTMGISSGTGEETHHGFYLVNISYVGGQYRNEFVWAPSATTNTSGVELSASMKITFPAIGAYRVEIKPLNNSQASNYWKVDSIAKWNQDAIWHYVDKSNANCTVSKNAPPTIEFSGEGVPSGNLPKGQSYELRGVVSASENIQSVTATIYDVSTQKAVSGIGTNPITIYPNSKSVDIYWSQINTSLKFGNMNDGNYRYELVVTTASGWKKTVADSTFTIGKSGGVRGDADGNGRFDVDDVILMLKYYLGSDVRIVSANCDLNGNGVSCDVNDVIAALNMYLEI